MIGIQVGKNTSLFVGGLAGQFGRVRDVAQSPDGYLYLALQFATGAGTEYGRIAPSPGLVVRLTPAE